MPLRAQVPRVGPARPEGAARRTAGRGHGVGRGRALLIYPEFEGDLRAFEGFRDEVRRGLRLFYCVAFHPDLPMDLSDENRAVSFLRRSPDPTLQLVRVATLDRVRSGRPGGSVYLDPSKLSADELTSVQPTLSVSEQIARANLRTLQRHDAARLASLLAELRRFPPP